MSKGHDGAEKVKEKTKETHVGKEAHGGKEAHTGKDGPTGETKKPTEHKKADAPTGHAKGKGHTPMPGGCFSWGCKTEATRFNFCNEHYDHFKFGLIKKTGEPVSDYEKKIEHYMAHKAKKGAQRVA